MALQTPIAKWTCGSQGGDITPREYRKRSDEFQHRTQLLCPHGHGVFFRAPEGKRCHFVHKSRKEESRCTYRKKYPGGESEPHIRGKLYFAERQGKGEPIEFNVLCTQRCGNILSSEKVDPAWTYTTEFAMRGGEIWADGVFLDGEEVKLVVEIFHTHKVGGGKLRWLQEQPFSFYEVSADLPADGKIPILNQSGGLGTCSECQARREEWALFLEGVERGRQNRERKEKEERERERALEREKEEREADQRKREWEAEVERRKVAERRRRVEMEARWRKEEAARKEEGRLEKERRREEKRRVRQEARAKRDLKVRGEKERKDREISRRKQQVARRKRDQALPEEVIREEVRRIRQEVGSFEDLHPMEKAQAIVRHRSFVSQRVNRILWGYGAAEVPKKKPPSLFG